MVFEGMSRIEDDVPPELSTVTDNGDSLGNHWLSWCSWEMSEGGVDRARVGRTLLERGSGRRVNR